MDGTLNRNQRQVIDQNIGYDQIRDNLTPKHPNSTLSGKGKGKRSKHKIKIEYNKESDLYIFSILFGKKLKLQARIH